VQTGTGLRRSQRRNAQNLASMIEALRAQPPEATPVARQTQAEASEVAADIRAAATTSEARNRPIYSALLTDTKASMLGPLRVVSV
jgi:hypothetical protein